MYVHIYVSVYICKEFIQGAVAFLMWELFWHPSYVRVLYACKQDLEQTWVDEGRLYRTLYQQLASKQYIKNLFCLDSQKICVFLSKNTHTLL